MNVTFCVVPPGGGEVDNQFTVDMPALPQNEDYIVVHDGEGHGHYYIVRRRWFGLNVDKQPNHWQHSYSNVMVEVEVAKGPMPCDHHKATCQMYENRGKVPREFENTMY